MTFTESNFPFTRSRNIVGNLHQLLQVKFIPEAIYKLVEKTPPATDLLVINHRDRYLSLSNETHYIYLLPVANQEILTEIKQQMQFIPTRKKIVVQLEQTPNLSVFEHHHTFKVHQIHQQAIKDGVPEINLFLVLLQELFVGE